MMSRQAGVRGRVCRRKLETEMKLCVSGRTGNGRVRGRELGGWVGGRTREKAAVVRVKAAVDEGSAGDMGVAVVESEDGNARGSNAGNVVAGWDPERVVRLTANSNSCHRVRELRRPLGEYMALPASQYSVLDARKVERQDEDTFVCYVGQVQFFQFVVEPVLTLRVVVVPMGCEINLLSCKIEGSKFVEDQNEKFSTTMKNRYGTAHHTHFVFF